MYYYLMLVNGYSRFSARVSPIPEANKAKPQRDSSLRDGASGGAGCRRENGPPLRLRMTGFGKGASGGGNVKIPTLTQQRGRAPANSEPQRDSSLRDGAACLPRKLDQIDRGASYRGLRRLGAFAQGSGTWKRKRAVAPSQNDASRERRVGKGWRTAWEVWDFRRLAASFGLRFLLVL